MLEDPKKFNVLDPKLYPPSSSEVGRLNLQTGWEEDVGCGEQAATHWLTLSPGLPGSQALWPAVFFTGSHSLLVARELQGPPGLGPGQCSVRGDRWNASVL